MKKCKGINLESLLPKAKVDSSIFACSSDSFSDIWNSARGDGSPCLNLNSLTDRPHSARNKIQFLNRRSTKIKPVPIIVPDNKVYKGVYKEQDYLDSIISKLKRNSLEKNAEGFKPKSKVARFSNINLSLEKRKIKPTEGLLIKSLDVPQTMSSFREVSTSPKELKVFPEEPQFLYKLPCVGNKVELKVNKKKIEFTSKNFNLQAKSDLKKKPYNSSSNQKIREKTKMTKTLYTEGKSPLVVNSLKYSSKYAG